MIAKIILDHGRLIDILGQLREAGETIVLTSGVFDLLHPGHARYLGRAKELGGILVVGVDTDDWVRARKGPSRPIRPFGERIELLAHLRHVDILTRKGEDDLTKVVRPDVMVISETSEGTTPAMMEEMGRHCGRLVCFPAQSNTHTTSIVAQMNGNKG